MGGAGRSVPSSSRRASGWSQRRDLEPLIQPRPIAAPHPAIPLIWHA